ncbi:UbiH/UbiF/VisC/COQ6 family ubiquinone biosynthesis hydroxylase [Pseudokordiimonas caeni]|uniref:UbiH/UbiF/VisC/COQ6 family ubiquinone biosynthesis hydroxylase n=1 Tax=Pseudokordiimonas caeni TaxID=2997908 RepID=UPI0028116005|nr:UbiH/UbiF/VisC/COQ6 family ubiquinone biosynthesis hydroxylase [Pseudokordiimonas caeni]
MPHDQTTDIAILGGGLAGLAAGIGLAAHGLDVTVIDRGEPGDQTLESFDGRSSAIAYASCNLLKAIGVWEHLEGRHQPIREIRVSDGPSLMHLHFDHRDLGAGPLGEMVENRHMRLALHARAKELPNLRHLAPASVTEIERDAVAARLTLADGNTITAWLLLGIDGRASQARRDAGITVTEWGYDQVGIVCSIEHELPHGGVAHERFLPSGPFAILPLTGNRSSLVWTEKQHLADTVMGLSPRAFEAEVQRRCGDFLGKVKVIGGRWCYPLTLQFADRYTDTRLALVGDAAHGIHPIAGQGLNMGLRDVAALIEVIVEAARAGLDIGSGAVLDRYARWREFDNVTLMGVTDVLNRLFSNDIAPVRIARDLGLAVVDRIPPLKNFFMAHARGTVGTLPKLLSGDRL